MTSCFRARLIRIATPALGCTQRRMSPEVFINKDLDNGQTDRVGCREDFDNVGCAH